MRVGFVEWPDGLQPSGPVWERIARSIEFQRPDLLITNELPFGPWIAAGERFEEKLAIQSIEVHEVGVLALCSFSLPAIVTSRPKLEDGRLENEAILIENGKIRSIHTKHYFPDEPGWREAEWYSTVCPGFGMVSVRDAKLGVLLCTELMFNEHARAYGRASATIIAVPRATGPNNRPWHTAAAMAALVSGSYVVSSNRIGSASFTGPTFGGQGFTYAPDGELIAMTSAERAVVVVDLDFGAVRRAQANYPCNVAERPNRKESQCG